MQLHVKRLESAAPKDKCCFGRVILCVVPASVCRGAGAEQGVWGGGLATLAQVFSWFSLSNKSRRKAGKQSPISEGNWAPKLFVTLFQNVPYALKSLRDCVSDV